MKRCSANVKRLQEVREVGNRLGTGTENDSRWRLYDFVFVHYGSVVGLRFRPCLCLCLRLGNLWFLLWRRPPHVRDFVRWVENQVV